MLERQGWALEDPGCLAELGRRTGRQGLRGRTSGLQKVSSLQGSGIGGRGPGEGPMGGAEVGK